MKYKLTLTAALLVGIFAYTGHTQGTTATKSLIKDAEVRMRFVETPLYKANVSSTRVTDAKWLQIMISYTMPEKKASEDRFVWIDEMTIEYEVLLPSEYKGKKVMALFKGAVTFWAVEMDGQTHKSTAFIPPQILKRYAQADMQLRGSTAKELQAMVTFYTKEKQRLGRHYSVPRGSTKITVAKNFANAANPLTTLKIENSILPRNLTPWAFLDFDSYDLIKFNTDR